MPTDVSVQRLNASFESDVGPKVSAQRLFVPLELKVFAISAQRLFVPFEPPPVSSGRRRGFMNFVP